MKVFFVNDSSDNSNWGDRAAATTLKWMVKEVGGEIIETLYEGDLKTGDLSKPPQAMNSRDADGAQRGLKKALRSFIPPIAYEFKNKLARRWRLTDYHSRIPNTIEQFESCREQVHSDSNYWIPLLTTLQKMDIAIIHGNGAMKGGRRMPRSILFLAYLIKKEVAKPVVIVNHTLDVDNDVLGAMADKIYPLFDDVVYREATSPAHEPAGADGRAGADSTFILNPVAKEDWVPVAQRRTYFDVWPDTADFDPAAPYICVGGSSIYSYYPDQYNPRRGFDRLIEHLREIYSGQIVLTVSAAEDEPFLRRIAVEKDLPLIGLSTPTQQAVDILGNAQAYVGGRWHPTIFALTGGVPIVALSAITFKIEALMEMCGLSTTFDALDLEGEKRRIGEQLLDYLAQGTELRDRLKHWASTQADASWENVAYLQNMDRPA